VQSEVLSEYIPKLNLIKVFEMNTKDNNWHHSNATIELNRVLANGSYILASSLMLFAWAVETGWGQRGHRPPNFSGGGHAIQDTSYILTVKKTFRRNIPECQ
jgi:hypothetical protein